MIRILFFTCLLAGLMQARTWTSPDGRKLEGEFVSATETEVTLKMTGTGKELTFPLTKLCDEDQAFISEQAKEMPAEKAEEEAAEESGPAAPIEGEYAELITGDWKLAEYKNLPYAFYGAKDLDGSKKYPLVVSLHGKSDNNENGKQIGFAKAFAKEENYSKRPSLILAPLCYQPHGGTGGGWNDAPGEETLDLIKDLLKKLPIVDPDRVYVIGYSMGGFGTWHFLKEEPRLFAAGIPIAGGGSGLGRLRSMPIWAWHGAKDTTVDVAGARAAAEELERSKVFKYTEMPESGHGIAGNVVDKEEVHVWLFEQKR